MLKVLMLKRKIDDAKKQLAEARAKKEDLQKRESEIASAINEAATDEEKAAVEDEITKFDTENAEVDGQIANLEKDVNDMEAELADIEARQETTPAPAVEAPTTTPAAEADTTRTNYMEGKIMKRFKNMTHEERSAFVAREDVKAFLERTRQLMAEKRSVSGAEYLIPEVIVEMIRANIEDYSKLLRLVNVKPVSGKARVNISGLIPEAIWTEMCGKLNELDFTFGQKEVDGYKVGGFVPVCNAVLEDSDIDLMNELLAGIGEAIGYALDKAIVYGTGTKMPVGIVTAIAGDSTIATKNIVSIPSTTTGKALFVAILKATKALNNKYARGGVSWVMNRNTKIDLMAEAAEFDATGAVVTSVNNAMPLAGGEIVELDFIPDGTIISGYYLLYLLAERAGIQLATSEHVRFIEDQTVFKGTARYDGKPVFNDAFVAIGINGTTPAPSDVTFAPDTANPADDDDAQG